MKIEVEIPDKAIGCQHRFGSDLVCRCGLHMNLLQFVPENSK